MHKKIILLVFLLGSLLQPIWAQEPTNLAVIKNKLVRYYNTGEYQQDQAKVIDQAMEYLKTRIENQKKSAQTKKLAIVLDIDETSLSNYSDLLSMDFGGTGNEINTAEDKGTDPAIQPTLTLYRYAKANNVAVFFITGRTENYRANTEKNLMTAGFKNWDGLLLKPLDYKEKTTAIYKSHMRDQIEKQGYDIVLNIGDQKSDLAGGHADKAFKLPNPYYFIP